MKHMYDAKWGKLKFEDRLEAVMCSCSAGIQDVHHIIMDCECTSHLLHNWLLQAEDVMINLIKKKKITEPQLHKFSQLSETEKLGFMIHMPYTNKGNDLLAHGLGLAAHSYLKSLTDFIKTLNTENCNSDPKVDSACPAG